MCLRVHQMEQLPFLNTVECVHVQFNTTIKATINSVKCKYVSLNSHHVHNYHDKGFIDLVTNGSGLRAGVNVCSSARVSQLASKQGIPHHYSLLLGNRIIAVVQDVAIPQTNPPQSFRFHQVCLGTNTLWVVIPNLMNLSFLILGGK